MTTIRQWRALPIDLVVFSGPTLLMPLMGAAAIQPEHFDRAIVAWITGCRTRSACFSVVITSVVRSFVEQGLLSFSISTLPRR